MYHATLESLCSHCEVNRSYEEKGERKYSNKTPKNI